MTTEREFVRQLTARFPVHPPVIVGIGDDGAVLSCGESSAQVVVTDMLLDRVHFDLRTTSVELAGRKAMAVNLSDLAAMGCRPTAAFVSLALPRSLGSTTPRFLQQLYDGIDALTRRYRFTLAGGDTNVWEGPFAINVCLIGEPTGPQSLLRSGARPGDVLFVTGALGGSLQSGRHLSFEPRVDESAWLVQNVRVHSMIDVSDGLAVDLHRMMEASGTAGEIEAARLPIHADVDAQMPDNASSVPLSPVVFPDRRIAAALGDGEDFELLFSVDQADAKRLEAGGIPFPVTRIGLVCDGIGCRIRSTDGLAADLSPSGWQHL